MPNGGGYSLQFYDVKPTKFGQFDNFITFSDNYGKQIYHFNGIDLNVNARFPFALTLQGGFSTGNMTEDDCEVGKRFRKSTFRQAAAARSRLTNRPPNGPGPIAIVSRGISRTSRDWRRTQIRKIDVLVSGTIQSKPYVGANFPSVASQSIPANSVTPNAAIAPSLGRPLAGGVPVTVLGLVKPGDKYGERLNQVDLRFGKLLRFRGTRTLVALDLFNAFNTNTTDVYQTVYGPTYIEPGVDHGGAAPKISAQFDF